MDSLSATLLVKALDGLSLRAAAISQNIANANSVHYRPLQVNFEETLRMAASQGEEAVRSVQPRMLQVMSASADPGVRLDMELAASSATSARYASLAEMLNRQLQLDAVAVSGTR